MASLNRVTLIGNLGKDPEIRVLNNGNKVASFSIATTEKWKDKSSGESKERTEWHNIVVFNDGLVGVIEKYLKKGSKCYVEGQLATRKWEKDGIDRYTTEVVLRGYGGTLILLNDKGEGGGRPAPSEDSYGKTKTGGSKAGGAKVDDPDDDIPF